MLENIGYQIKTKKMYLERIQDTAVFSINKQYSVKIHISKNVARLYHIALFHLYHQWL